MVKEKMMRTDTRNIALAGALALTLAACGTTGPSASGVDTIPVTNTTSSASGYGVVESIDVVPREQAGVGLGTVAGAVVGGLLGNQVGSGRGRTAATVAGAAGGAYAGNKIENARSAGQGQVYRIAVRLDNGAVQTLVQDAPPNVQVGQRVRLSNGTIVQTYR